MGRQNAITSKSTVPRPSASLSWPQLFVPSHTEILAAWRQRRKTTGARKTTVTAILPASSYRHAASGKSVALDESDDDDDMHSPPRALLAAPLPSTIPEDATPEDANAAAAQALLSLAQLSSIRSSTASSVNSHLTTRVSFSQASEGSHRTLTVQQQQMQVAILNARPLSPPTAADARLWNDSNVGPGVPFLAPGRLAAIIEWRTAVDAVPAWHRIPGIRRFRPVFHDTKQWMRRDPRLIALPVRPRGEIRSWDDLIAMYSQANNNE
ncbi:hypothetical protein C8F01DRAFT_1252750 [Mycena amicta]|nr:hypothetical protein C8F01DRAFT_1252750 [Mycena amicta]